MTKRKQRCLIVPGTWSRRKGVVDYFHPGGNFVTLLEREGYKVCGLGKTYWTTNLNGTLIQRIFSRQGDSWHRDWITGGECLAHFIETLDDDPEELVVFCHSHGLQVVLYALQQPSCPPIGALCSVGSPDRDDMHPVMKEVRHKVGNWIHMQMGFRKDRFHWAGTLGSGSWRDTLGGAIGLEEGPPYADRRDTFKRYDHSEALNNPELEHVWIKNTPAGRPPILKSLLTPRSRS